MKLKVTDQTGAAIEVDVDIAGLLDIDDWDNQELALLESQIGAEKMEAWFARQDTGVPTFELINSLIWCRLSSRFPGLGVDAFRFKMGGLVAALREVTDSPPAAAAPDAQLEASLAAQSDQSSPSE